MRYKVCSANNVCRVSCAARRKVSLWRSKKPDERQAAKPEPKNLQGNQPSGPAAASLQRTTQVNEKAVGPTGAMMGTVAALLGANLHVRGEITGTEDLVIEGTFEGLDQLDEGKLR